MSLQVWLPLNGSMKNQGLCGVSTIDQSNGTFVAGKLGQCLHTSTSSINTNLIASEWDYSINSISLAGWFKFNKSEINAILPQSITSSTATTPTGTLIGYNSYGGLALTWRTNNIYSSGALSSFEVAGTLRGSVATSTAWKSLNFDEWYHLCLTFNIDTKKMSLYVNGILFNSYIYSGTINNPTQNCFININNIQGGNGPSRCIPFYLNDVRIYNHCLSAKEVKIISQGLILHYPLNDPYIELGQNLCTVIRPGAGTDVVWGGHVAQWTLYDATNDPVPFNEGIKGEIIYGENGSTGGGASRSICNIAALPSTTYTYSCYIKPSDNFIYTTPNFLYKYEYTAISNGTKITEAGYFNTERKKYIGNGWYRIWGSFTTQSNTNCLNISFYTYPLKSITYWIGGWQIEQKDHVTPFMSPGTSRNENIVYDTSGYCNNGTVTGTLNTSTDTPKYDYSIVFPSGSHYIDADRGAMVTDAITVNLWCKYSTWGNPISCTEGGGWNFEFTSDSGIRFPLYITGVGYKLANSNISTNTLLNEWHMLTGTYDKTNVKIYIDGELKGTAATNSTNNIGYPSGNAIFIGAEAAGNHIPASTAFVGNISDVRIYATALSAEDIVELYSVGASIDNQGNIYSAMIQEV